MATLAARAHPAAVAPTAESAPLLDGRLASLRALLRFGLVMAVLLAAASLPTSSFLAVREIAVLGAQVVPKAAIASRSGIRRGDRLRGVDPARAARRIAAIPRIASARVTVGLGGRVTLTVVERRPYAAVPYRGRYLILDPDGVVMDTAAGPGRLPVVTADGLAPPWMRPGDRLPDPGIALAVRALAEIPSALRSPGARLRAQRSGDLVMVTPDGITVPLGPLRGLRERAELLPEVLAAVRARRITVEYLDLRFAGRVVMKPASAPGAGERP